MTVTMLMIQVLSLMVCVCSVTSWESTTDSGDCLWNNEAFIRQSFESTCSQQLLMQVKQSVDNISALLMPSKKPEPTPKCEVGDQKQQLVTALTGKSNLSLSSIR